MKTFIAALLLISTQAFATELDATEALLNTLPAGSYSGISVEGDNCSVAVQKLSTGVNVSASSNGKTKSYEILNGSGYRWNPGQRLFFSSIITRTSDSSSENFIRSIAVKNTTQYVVVGNISRTDNGTKESVIECVINL